MTDVFTVLFNCTACGACLATCPERCIRVAPRDAGVPLMVLEELCTGCGECAEICPAEAIVPLAEVAGAITADARYDTSDVAASRAGSQDGR